MNYYNAFAPDGNNNNTNNSASAVHHPSYQPATTTTSAAPPQQQSQYSQQPTSTAPYFAQADARNIVAPPPQLYQQQHQHHHHFEQPNQHQQQPRYQELRQADNGTSFQYQPYSQQQQQQQQQLIIPSAPITAVYQSSSSVSNLSPLSSSSSNNNNNHNISSPPSALATLLSKLSNKYNCLIAPEVIPILEKNCFDETNVLFLDKETLVELQIPIGGRVSLLKIIEEEKKSRFLNQQNPNFSSPFQGQNFVNHFIVPHQDNNNNNNHHGHYQNVQHHHQHNHDQQQQRFPDRSQRESNQSIKRLAVMNTQDPELRQLFDSKIILQDWVSPPSDSRLRAKLVDLVWGGFDPWNETTCERCKKWAFKITLDWTPRANRHPTEMCMIFNADGTSPKTGKEYYIFSNDHQHQQNQHQDRFPNFQQQQQFQQPQQHDNNINNDNNHNNHSNNNQQQQQQQQQRRPVLFPRGSMLMMGNRQALSNTLDPQLQQILQSRFNGSDWIDPPADAQLRAKLVALWGGTDPWNETVCERCRKWSHKVTHDFLPRAMHHTTDKCVIWGEDGTALKAVQGARGHHHDSRRKFGNNDDNNTNDNNNSNNDNNNNSQQVAVNSENDFVDVYYQEDDVSSAAEKQSFNAGAPKMSGQRREREEENDEH